MGIPGDGEELDVGVGVMVEALAGEPSGDHGPHRRRFLEAVAAEPVGNDEAIQLGGPQDGIHVLHVDGVETRQARDRPSIGQRRDAVVEAVDLRVPESRIDVGIEVVGLGHLFLLVLLAYGTYEYLLAAGLRPEVDAARVVGYHWKGPWDLLGPFPVDDLGPNRGPQPRLPPSEPPLILTGGCRLS